MADKIAKLLAKLPPQDLKLLLPVIRQLTETQDLKGLGVKSLKNSGGLLRVRVGNYRIIFTNKNGQILILALGRRNEKTYRGL